MIVEVMKCDGCGREIQGDPEARYRYAGKPACHFCAECARRFKAREDTFRIIELAKFRPDVAELTYNQAVQAASMGAVVRREDTGKLYRYRDGAMEILGTDGTSEEPHLAWSRDTGTSGPWRVSEWRDSQ